MVLIINILNNYIDSIHKTLVWNYLKIIIESKIKCKIKEMMLKDAKICEKKLKIKIVC